MAEAKIKIPMTNVEYIQYLEMLCEEIPKQAEELKVNLSAASP